MIDVITFVPLFSAFAHLFLFSYIYGQRQRHPSNRAFLLFSAGFCVICILEYFIRLPLPQTAVSIFTKIALPLSLFLPFIYLYFVYTVVRKRRDNLFTVLLFLTTVSSIVSLFIKHHRFTTSAAIATKVMAPTYLYIPFFIIIMLSSFMSMILLYHGWKKDHLEVVRNQCRVLFWGAIVTFCFGFLILFVIPIFFKGYSLYRFQSLCSVMHSAFIYWAMTKYGLMVVDIAQIRKVSKILFHNIRDGVVVTDRNGTIVQMNETARGMFPSSDNIKKLAQIADLLPNITFVNKFSNKKLSYKCLDEEKTIVVSHAPVNDRDSKLGYISVFRDISDQQRLEEAVNKKNQIESLGRLAGGIAHDFNNQLTGIMGCADVLRVELKNNPSQYELADIIVKAVRRSSDLTGQLLAFSRKGKYQNISLNIHDIISDVVKMLDRTIDKRIKLVQHLDAQMPFICGDHSQLHNVFLNIGLNARDAMPQGGELIFRTQDSVIDSSSHRMSKFDITKGQYVMITVIDTGEGMSPSVQKRVFEPFYTTKEKGKGIGMGLSAAYGTIRNHNGEIAINSGEGKGTTVTINLPVSHEIDTMKEMVTTQKPNSSHLNILLVEDEEVVAIATKIILQKAGHSITGCINGQSAIDYYKKSWQETHIIILDIILPDISGYETFTAMKSINPSLIVLLSSGYSVDSEAQRILDKGAMGFIQKPYRADELVQKIETLFRNG